MKKDLRRNAKKRAANQSTKASLKTLIKKVRKADEPAVATTNAALAQKALDKASQRGIIHKNQAARRTSRMMKAANAKAAAAK